MTTKDLFKRGREYLSDVEMELFEREKEVERLERIVENLSSEIIILREENNHLKEQLKSAECQS